jgi:hypothetical protein
LSPRSQLPLWKTVGEAYAMWVRNFPDLVRACWIWLLLMTPVWVAWTMWWRVPHMEGVFEALRAGEQFDDPNPLVTGAALAIDQIMMLPAVASVAVAWHRLLLRGQRPGSAVYLRLDKIVVAYAILAFAGGAILMAPYYAGMMIQFVIESGAITNTAAALLKFVDGLVSLAALVPMFILARLSLLLPAIALGRNDVTLGAVWNASEGNSWRMFGAYFFCVMPWIAVTMGIAAWQYHHDQGREVATLVWMTTILPFIPVSMISVGMLSLAYRHFFESTAENKVATVFD